MQKWYILKRECTRALCARKGTCMENDGKVIALLIDAENVSPKYIKTIVDEVSMYGTDRKSVV